MLHGGKRDLKLAGHSHVHPECSIPDSSIRRSVTSFDMLKAHEVPKKEIAALNAEFNKPRIAASVALTGYACSRCGCQFPESQPPKGRTAVESRRLAKAHTAREFALHVCAERGWPPLRRKA
jgi:hypothetical protein